MKVLIADDDPYILRLIQKRLENWGYEVRTATNGKDALGILRQEDSPRLVVLDWMMPEMDGLAVCRRIKSDNERDYTYIIILTSRGEKEDIVQGLNAGADDFLSKHVNSGIFRARLQVGERIIEAVPPRAWSLPKVPGYEIHRLLAKGSMGSVWEATHTQRRQRVALKLVRSALLTDRCKLRFAREISIARSLDHPYICRIYEDGALREVLYYAMELIQGQTLAQHVKARDLGHLQTTRLMHKVCQAIGFAHGRGVVHRDLKPGNILITEAGEPKIVDFGLAKTFAEIRSEGDPWDNPELTKDGVAVGTPLFMSPEQASASNHQVDARSDVYALGTVLYLLLLGKHPHALEETNSRDIANTIAKGRIRPPRQFDPRIDPLLERVLLRALAAEPEQRYPDASALAKDLEAYCQGQAEGGVQAEDDEDDSMHELMGESAFLVDPNPSSQLQIDPIDPDALTDHKGLMDSACDGDPLEPNPLEPNQIDAESENDYPK